jgi:hypothetical protein
VRFVFAATLLVSVILITAVPDNSRAADKNPIRRRPRVKIITPQIDAAGGCDGIKNGRWGFHTGQATEPWWQVDLGKVEPIACVVIWNRCDGAALRANHLMVKLSDNGRQWRTVHHHDGTTFRGHTDNKPLVVKLKDQAGRFVRIQLPGKDYLHLDEVEVFGPANPEKNLAFNRPANQVSASAHSLKQQLPSPAVLAIPTATSTVNAIDSAYIKMSTPIETYIESVTNYNNHQIRYGPWHIIGPFDENHQTFPSAGISDLKAQYTGQNNQQVRWTEHTNKPLDVMGWISLYTSPEFKGSFPLVGYLGSYISSPVDREEEIQMVVGDASVIPWKPCKFEAWLNGKPVKPAGKTKQFRLAFKAGRNFLLVRIEHGQKNRLMFISKPIKTQNDIAIEEIRARVMKDFPDQPIDLIDEFYLLREDIALHQSDNRKNREREAFLATQVLGKEVLILDGDRDPLDVVLRRIKALLAEVTSQPDAPDLSAEAGQLAGLQKDNSYTPPADMKSRWGLFLKAAKLRRRIAFSHPLLNFDDILFTKRVPGSFNHMSDQYYGWWSKPGGGIYILRNFKSDSAKTECITESFKNPGSFLRPMLSYDAQKVLFAWCKHYPDLADEQDKLNKDNVPEDAFYHIFEMNIDGTGVRKLTHGKYDDFDARYLPDGQIVFLSTRRGHFIQCGPHTAQQTLTKADLPDSYVRCGGGAPRPVAIYTLHTMDGDGGNMCAISPFENFEWTPSVADDGTIMYSRWDYVDRYNNAFMSMWAIKPDGSNSRLVYGNHTWSPHTTFEARCIPNSHKIVFTASAHHGQTMGSLVLLDPSVGTEGEEPITRLSPEILFPEIEGWSKSFYANPWPISERLYLTAWGFETKVQQWKRLRVPNGMGLYLFDATGNRVLLHRDPKVCCVSPIPLRPRRRPPVLASNINWDGPHEGRFLLNDVYNGLKSVKRGEVKALRIVAVPPKTQPVMNFPNLGFTHEDPGKCVLGNVPVEEDGSAYFRVPAGMSVFFQALDDRGMAVQTMRTLTHVQPGQTLSCIGCHESRTLAPPVKRPRAATRQPSRIAVGPEGTWPMRFDRLVQPVLEQNCVRCHNPNSEDKQAAKFNLTADYAYGSMSGYGEPNLIDLIREPYKLGYSTPGKGIARQSRLLDKIADPKVHKDLKLDAESLERLIIWMDIYVQRLGSFSPEQEQRLLELRKRSANLLIERPPTAPAADEKKLVYNNR